jgi:hypothetical protein
MTVALPNGYVSILEAADMLMPAMYAGVPDSSAVTRVRQEGLDVMDGSARDTAIAEIWNAVDEGKLRPMAIGGQPRRVERLSAASTRQIPMLRSPRGRGFTALRFSHFAFRELVSCFGRHLSTVTLAFRELEIHRLARKLNRTRRKGLKSKGPRQRGRPSQQPLVRSIIEALIAEGEFLPLKGLKAFTLAVNKKGKFEPPVSVDTVVRVLDQLHCQTKDRRFQRLHRTRADNLVEDWSKKTTPG